MKQTTAVKPIIRRYRVCPVQGCGRTPKWKVMYRILVSTDREGNKLTTDHVVRVCQYCQRDDHWPKSWGTIIWRAVI